MPTKVTFTDGSTIAYSYTTNGAKLRTVHTISGTTTTKDYCGNVIYEKGIQKMLLTEEGYVDLTASTPTYYYYLKDHQGNNRVVINSSGTVAETNHYYPFGGIFAGTSIQPYKYNGKELDTSKGLNWYDYGARHYDTTLGRWHSVDPLAEKYYSSSPFVYCGESACPMAGDDCFEREGTVALGGTAMDHDQFYPKVVLILRAGQDSVAHGFMQDWTPSVAARADSTLMAIFNTSAHTLKWLFWGISGCSIRFFVKG